MAKEKNIQSHPPEVMPLSMAFGILEKIARQKEEKNDLEKVPGADDILLVLEAIQVVRTDMPDFMRWYDIFGTSRMDWFREQIRIWESRSKDETR